MIPPPLLCRCFDIVRVVFLFLLPLGKFTLAFLTLVIRQNVGEETSGNRLDFVVRDLGVIDHLFPPGHRRHLLMEDCGSSAILQYAKEALAENASLFPPEGRIFLCCGTDLPQSPDFPPLENGARVCRSLSILPPLKRGEAR